MTKNPNLTLTDGGLETTMVFHEGFELPCFAAFTLLQTKEGRAALDRYFDRFIDVAARNGTAYALDTVTWRANPNWGREIGLSPEETDQVNRDSVAFARAVKARHAHRGLPITLNGVVGPEGDGYRPDSFLSTAQARDYHARQIRVLAEERVDTISAITMTYAEEGAGIALAARDAGLPSIVSFTLETDGNLPNGMALKDAIKQVDAETGSAPRFYMINCAHPDHFTARLDRGAKWLQRIGGIRANASRLSHAALDVATKIDDGDPKELAEKYRAFLDVLPNLALVGGCCGTDHRHVDCVAAALTRTPATA